MSDARKVSKRDLELLSDLVFDSYTTIEFDFLNHHFIMRSLTTNEREDLYRRYFNFSSKYNLMLVLDMLAYSIMFINGNEFDKQKHKMFLYKLNSRIILNIYKKYQEMDDEIKDCSVFIDYYVESRQSRNMWSVFKTCSRINDPFSIRKLNQYQYYWIITNVFKDNLDKEKKSWAKVEYMTNSICAFINPKGFKRSRSSSVVDQLEKQEDKEKQRLVEEIETGITQQYVDSNDVFSSMDRKNEETDEEYEYRVNILMEKTLKGELVDEHDKIVRKSEIDCLKKFLRERRTQVLVEREVRNRQGIKFDDLSTLEKEAMQIQLEEDKQNGFFHDNFSYIDIIKMKDFAAITKIEKEKIFEEVMNEDIDIDDEVDNFLKRLSRQDIISFNSSPIDNNLDNARDVVTDSSVELAEFKTPAQKAANMDIDIKGINLLKQKQEKVKRAIRVLNKRKYELDKSYNEEDQNLDIIKFD